MDQELLKSKIKEKFKTISEFGRVSGIDRTELQKALMPFYATNQHYIDFRIRINEDVDRLAPRINEDDLTPSKLEWLEKEIKDRGGVVKFCRDNPQFSKDSVFHILQGRRKKINGVVRILFDFLGYVPSV